jgi:hypothetical protein
MEWTYRNIPPWARQGRPSGSIVFAQLPDGAWFIQRWTLRAPVAQVFAMRADTAYYGVKIRESEVIEVSNRSGRLLARFGEPDARP